jgi:hypothetical protein
MSLTRNTYNGGDIYSTLSWTLGHLPTSTEEAYVDSSSIGEASASLSTPITCGAFTVQNVGGGEHGISLDTITNNVIVLGDLRLEDTSMATFDRVDGTVIDGGCDLALHTLNGTWNITTDLIQITTGGIGITRFTYNTTSVSIPVGFTGTIIADGVNLDLQNPILSPSVTLHAINGGSFLNYRGGPKNGVSNKIYSTSSYNTITSTVRKPYTLGNSAKKDGGSHIVRSFLLQNYNKDYSTNVASGITLTLNSDDTITKNEIAYARGFGINKATLS